VAEGGSGAWTPREPHSVVGKAEGKVNTAARGGGDLHDARLPVARGQAGGGSWTTPRPATSEARASSPTIAVVAVSPVLLD
jgi:hypothetical protein